MDPHAPSLPPAGPVGPPEPPYSQNSWCCLEVISEPSEHPKTLPVGAAQDRRRRENPELDSPGYVITCVQGKTRVLLNRVYRVFLILNQRTANVTGCLPPSFFLSKPFSLSLSMSLLSRRNMKGAESKGKLHAGKTRVAADRRGNVNVLLLSVILFQLFRFYV